MKNNFKVIFVLIGTMIGAGFASGKEIYLFFNRYGLYGLIGVIISTIFTGIIIYRVFQIVQNKPEKNYEQFLELISNKSTTKTNYIIKTINIIINAFLLISFYIMVAGFSAYFEQEFGIVRWIGSIIILILSYFTFLGNIDRIMKMNTILIPILIIFIIHIGAKNVDFMIENFQKMNFNSENFFSGMISSILYGSYNSILLIPVLITLKNYINHKKQIRSIATITVGITILLSVMIFLLLVKVEVDITQLEMPAVYVVSNMFKFLRVVYGFIILGSIFTTSISLGTSFLQNVGKNRKSYTPIALSMCITAVLVSKIGFSNLINSLYPIFGYLGLIQIVALIFKKQIRNIVNE